MRKLMHGLSLCLAMVVSAIAAADTQWRTLDWIELMPAEDLKLLESLPEIQHEGDGPVTLPDEIMTGRVVPEMDNVPARIPGFIVPLKTVGDQRIVEFFLVPYYGACIHVPPPPPNQIIHVTYPEGIELEVLYEPFWIQGPLTISRTEHDIGTASYAIRAEAVTPYE
ncbi:MAG: DUF3299 domain-containing protein [Marinobacter sp.]|uniref:DUF3299 domain-containing protein n=1 Tax=Marinobacter sp. TaxID=50741 RepID=UPI00299EA0A6|nr:DUF3299 domain-containing protein [Marinobacter sp.]MDX1633325.1 DUF3299 domain-containing protein [Marinobacter sp.]